MPSLSKSYRQNVEAAWHQLEVEADQREAASQREAQRMMYRPPSRYIRTPRFVVWFSWLGAAAAIFVWLVKLNHWWGY
jgi:hypothetical protein